MRTMNGGGGRGSSSGGNGVHQQHRQRQQQQQQQRTTATGIITTPATTRGGGQQRAPVFSSGSLHRFFYWSMVFFVINTGFIFVYHHYDLHHHVDAVDSATPFQHPQPYQQQQQQQQQQKSYSNINNIAAGVGAGADTGGDELQQHEAVPQKDKEFNKPEEEQESSSQSSESELPIFAICLLTRDDVPILAEWIAYHYHAVQLRHLIVAVDPLSQHNPHPVLETFRQLLGNHTKKKNTVPFRIEQWNDTDYMPAYFLNGEYGQAPNFVGNSEHPDAETWYAWYSNRPKNMGFHKIQDQTLVNNHRYRQTRFLAQCSQYLHDYYNTTTTNTKNHRRRPVWMSTLDSDEYLAINPWMMQDSDIKDVTPATAAIVAGKKPDVVVEENIRNNHNKIRSTSNSDNHKNTLTLTSSTSTARSRILRLESGSVLQWLVEHTNTNTKQNTNKKNNICIPIPRLLFGSVEFNTTFISNFARKNITTIRTANEMNNTNGSTDVTNGLIRRLQTTHQPDDTNTPVQLIHNLPRRNSTMETLRWKYHAAPDDVRNYQQKVILDLYRIPANDTDIWGSGNRTGTGTGHAAHHVHTVHRPSKTLCLPETSNNLNGTLLLPSPRSSPHAGRTVSPVVAYHYIGSAERYFARKNDLRRNPKRYRERSDVTYKRDTSQWIDQWLPQFINDVGIEIAAKLLHEHILPPPPSSRKEE